MNATAKTVRAVWSKSAGSKPGKLAPDLARLNRLSKGKTIVIRSKAGASQNASLKSTSWYSNDVVDLSHLALPPMPLPQRQPVTDVVFTLNILESPASRIFAQLAFVCALRLRHTRWFAVVPSAPADITGRLDPKKFLKQWQFAAGFVASSIRCRWSSDPDCRAVRRDRDARGAREPRYPGAGVTSDNGESAGIHRNLLALSLRC